MPRLRTILVTVEGEVHFLDAVALGAGAELGLGAGRAAAEQNEVGLVHDDVRTAETAVSGSAFFGLRSASGGFSSLRALVPRGRAARGASASRRRRSLAPSSAAAFLMIAREHRAGLAALGRPVR